MICDSNVAITLRVMHSCNSGPKGQPYVSPGQRPGNNCNITVKPQRGGPISLMA